MATIEIPDDWLESTGLSPEAAKDYLLAGYPVMKEICLYHMTSTIIRTPPNSIIGHARIILSGMEGTVTEGQSEDLRLIIHSAEFLFEHLSNFIYMVSSVFKNHSIYLNNLDIIETVKSKVSFLTRNCEYEVEYNVPDKTLTIRSDQILIDRLLSGMFELAKQIRPTHKGAILISIEQVKSAIQINISTTQDAEYPFQLSDNNPFVFMADWLAKELKGYFRIVRQENSWQITTSFPIVYE